MEVLIRESGRTVPSPEQPDPAPPRARDRPPFEIPRSIEEAEERRLDLVAQVQRIGSDLQDPNKTGSDGIPLTGNAYWAWRHSAVRALHIKQSQLAELKLWLKRQRVGLDLAVKSDHGPVRAAYHLLRKLIGEVEDVEQSEVEVLDGLKNWLSPDMG